MKSNKKSLGTLVIGAIILSTCSGCRFIDYFKEKLFRKKSLSSSEMQTVAGMQTTSNDTSPVVLYIDGQPILHKSQIDDKINQFVQAQFQGSVSADNLPPAFKKIIIDRLIEQELVVAWERKNNVESRPEFIKAYEENIELLKATLMIREFQKELVDSVKISDREVRDDYEKNKSRYVKSSGGMLAFGAKFDDKEHAEEFENKVRGQEEKFEELAQAEEGAVFKQLGRVDAETVNHEIPAAVKEAIVTYKGSTPELIAVNDGNDVWEVCLSNYKESELYPFDDIKAQIETMLQGQRANELYASKIKELKNMFTIKINEEALGLLDLKNDFSKNEMVEAQLDEDGALQSEMEERTSTAA